MRNYFTILRPASKGFTTLSLVISAGLLSVLFTFIFKALLSADRYQRGIASNDELESISHLIRMLTESADKCAKSGLLYTDISDLLNPSNPTPVEVSLGNPSSAKIEAGIIFSSLRKIESVQLTSATLIGAIANRTYFATLKVRTKATGDAVTFRKPDPTHYLIVTTDPNGLILSCSSGPDGPGGLSKIRFGGFIHRCPYNYDPATYAKGTEPPIAPFDLQRPKPMAPGNQLTGTQNCAVGFKPQLLFSLPNYFCSDMFYAACSWHRDFPTKDYANASLPGCSGPECSSISDPVDPIPVLNNQVSLSNQGGPYKWRGCGVLTYVCTADDRRKGDANGDGRIDQNDFTAFRNAMGGSDPLFDFDEDGDVDQLDYNQFRNEFGT